MSDTVELAKSLLAKASITPDDQDCQAILKQRLTALGFTCETMQYGRVTNLWARLGNTGPHFMFAGHTDVVPTGNTDAWTNPPFTPTLKNNFLYARGAVDMKGAIAAMVTACERFCHVHPSFNGQLSFLITSDEEDGSTGEGTEKVLSVLKKRGVNIDYCLVGEPTSDQQFGDMMKNGRRGSLSAHIIFHGVQGHIAYPEKANNPIPLAMAACHALATAHWDAGDAHFQATQCQISNIHAGTGATNVIPATVEVDINFRYSPSLSADEIQRKTAGLLNQFDIEHTSTWHHSGQPYLTQAGQFSKIVMNVISEVTSRKPVLSTHGGTSDARFIATLPNVQVIEFGLRNETAHKVDECVSVNELNQLSTIYEKILENIFCQR